MNITISDSIRTKFPELRIGTLMCEVQNSETSDALWNELELVCTDIKNTFLLEEINKRPTILATRKAYKVLGKDPNRYRPSAEALCRRILRDIPIYRLSTLVDIINIVSIKTGFSIGGFDSEKIVGDIELGVGNSNDVFEAIGRGLLNIDGLPVYRDAIGGVGTPTSDNERTKITSETKRILLIFNAYNGNEFLMDAISDTSRLLTEYASARNIYQKIL